MLLVDDSSISFYSLVDELNISFMNLYNKILYTVINNIATGVNRNNLYILNIILAPLLY